VTLIPVFQRQQLPLGQSGRVKPSFQLADRSGQIALGSQVAEFGGAMLDRITRAKANTEFYRFRGDLTKIEADVDRWITENPDATVEQFTTQQNNALALATKAGDRASTGLARDRISDFLEMNDDIFRQRTQFTYESIESKRQFNSLAKEREIALQTGDYPRLERAINDARGNLYSDEEADLQLELDTIRFDKLAADRVKQQAESDETVRGNALFEAAAQLPELEGRKLINQADDITTSNRNAQKARLSEHHSIRRSVNQKEVNTMLVPGATVESLLAARENLKLLDMEPDERSAADAQLLSRIREIDQGVDVFTPQATKRRMETEAHEVALGTERDKEDFKSRLHKLSADGEISGSLRDEWIGDLEQDYKSLESQLESDALKEGSVIVQDAFGGFASLVELKQALEQAGTDEKRQEAIILELEDKNELQISLQRRYDASIRKIVREQDLGPKEFNAAKQLSLIHYRELARTGVRAMEAERALFESGVDLTDTERERVASLMVDRNITTSEAIELVETTNDISQFKFAPPRKIGIGETLKRTLGNLGSGAAPPFGGGAPAAKPVRKGPIKITGFQNGAESIVSKTVGGKQVEGIKTKDGREIFKGDEFILAGKVWRYDGDGKATQLRNAPVRKR